MENRSCEGEPPSGSPPKDPKSDPGPSVPRADPIGDSKDQEKGEIPPSAQIPDDEDQESPPAYKNRYMTEENKQNIDFEDPDPQPPEEVHEPRDVRLDPEFQQQASRRRRLRYLQSLVPGTCCLRPDPPDSPLSSPEPYPGSDGEQPVDAPDPGQQEDDAVDSIQQDEDALDSGEQATSQNYAIWNGCVSFYKLICSFGFQFTLHSLLLIWPLAMAILGVLNQQACRINYALPYVMIAVGLFGIATISFRLYVIKQDQRVGSVTDNYWIWLRAAEFIIWDFFSVQLYLFFKQAPTFDPNDGRYCGPKLYNINCGFMFLASATMIGWIVVNVGTFICWFRRRRVLPIN